MEFLSQESSTNSAAQTGTAVHLAVAEFHKRKEINAAVAAMRAARDRFPLADLQAAELQARRYAEDPRNSEVELVAIEHKIEAVIDGVHLVGTMDQLRRVERRLLVYDVKTSSVSGWRVMNDYLYQIAAYAVVATEVFGEDVHPGAVICTKAYTKHLDNPSPDGVFFEYGFDLCHAQFLMRSVYRMVEEIRRGNVAAVPGEHCSYCIGIQECIPKLMALEK